MIRIFLFLLTNLAVIFVFGIILSFLGIQGQSIPGLMIMASLFGFGGSFFSLLISKWMALRLVGGEVIVNPKTEIEHWLLDTVKRQAHQVDIKMPEVAVYHTLDMNAFATGAFRDSSLLTVSTSLLENMNRDEAEAVIAHEISHISNGDMVTMTLLQGILNTFVIFISRIIAQIASSFFATNNNNSENRQNNTVMYYSASIVLEIIFGILATIITMWFSRYREYRADAGSANLVGKDKMIAALQRLKMSYEPQEKSSMMAFYINGRSQCFNELFLSHPPIEKRIEALRMGTHLTR